MYPSDVVCSSCSAESSINGSHHKRIFFIHSILLHTANKPNQLITTFCCQFCGFWSSTATWPGIPMTNQILVKVMVSNIQVTTTNCISHLVLLSFVTSLSKMVRRDVTLDYVTRVHHASLQVTCAHWLRRCGGRGFTLVTWHSYVITWLPDGSVPVKC